MLALDSLNITLLHLSHVISCYYYCCRCLGLGGLDEILLLDRPARLDRASQRAFPRFNMCQPITTNHGSSSHSLASNTQFCLSNLHIPSLIRVRLSSQRWCHRRGI